MEWFDKTFATLTVNELFQIYKLRATVFNTEQQSDYCDPDDQDPLAHHVFGIRDGQVIAYARYFKNGDDVTFGRVVIAKEARGQGLGHPLMQQILKGIAQHFPGNEIRIHAQVQVEGYYAKFGFTPVGKVFTEADRKHIEMVYPGR